MASKNIVLKGATWNGVESIDLPVSGGGTARFVETSDSDAVASDVAQGKTCYVNGSKITGTASGGGSWSWAGDNPTKIKTYESGKVYLKDTAYATWTPTTTQTTLASTENVETLTVDFTNYDFVLVYRWHTHFEYGSGVTGTARISDYYATNYAEAIGYEDNLNSMSSGSASQTAVNTGSMKYGTFYKNSQGADSYGATVSYGVYITSVPTPTCSYSAQSLLYKIPTIYARCSTSSFSTDNASAVDQTTSYYECKIEIWRVDRGTSNSGNNVATIRDMWLNGI